MILKLLRHDRAWLTGLVIAPVMAFFAVGFGGATAAVTMLRGGFVALQFAMLVAILTYARGHVRATPFEMALPIEASDLFMARAVSSLIIVWLPAIFAFVAALALRSGMQGAMQMMDAAPILSLALLLPLTLRFPEAAAPIGPTRALNLMVTTFGVLSWIFLGPAVSAVIFAVASVVVLVLVLPRIPPSFQLAPADPERRDAAGPARVSVPSNMSAWMAIWRSFSVGYWTVIYFALMIAEGFLGTWQIFFALFIVQAAAMSRQRSRWIFALPLSPRTLLLLTLLATTAPLIGGAALGELCMAITS